MPLSAIKEKDLKKSFYDTSQLYNKIFTQILNNCYVTACLLGPIAPTLGRPA